MGLDEVMRMEAGGGGEGVLHDGISIFLTRDTRELALPLLMQVPRKGHMST